MSSASPTSFIEFATLTVFWGSSASNGQCLLPQSTVFANVTEGTTTIDFPNIEIDPDFSVQEVPLSSYANMIMAAMNGEENAYAVPLTVPHPYYEIQQSSTLVNEFALSLPQGLLEWLKQDPYFASQYSGIGLCVAGNGTGSPIVHIPVTQLTAESSTTIHMAGALTSTGIPTLFSSPAAPASRKSSAGPTSASSTITQQTTIAQASSQAVPVLASQTLLFTSESAPTTSPSSPASQASHDSSSLSSAAQTDVQSSGQSDVETSTLSSASVASSAGASDELPPATSTAQTKSEYVPVIQAGSQKISYSSADLSKVVVASSTLVPGGSAVMISSHTISLASSGIVVVDGQSSALAPSVSSISAVTLGGVEASALSSGVYIVAGQTLSEGGSEITANGQTISLAPSGTVVVGGKSSAINPQVNQSGPITLGGVAGTLLSSNTYAIAEQTIVPGGSAIIVSGHSISLAPSNTIVVDGVSSALGEYSTAVTLGGVLATPQSSGVYVLSSQTLLPGGSAVTLSGTTYSLPAAGGAVVINGQAATLPAAGVSDAGGNVTGADVLTIGTHSLPYTPVALTGVKPLVIGSQTIYPGGPAATVNGQTMGLALSNPSAIVVNGATSTLSAVSGLSALSLGTQTLMLTPLGSAVVFASQTLYPGGPAITVAGETISLQATGSSVVVAAGGATSTEGLGGYILSGLGGSGGSTSGSLGAGVTNSGVVPFTGGSAKLSIGWTNWNIAVVIAGLVGALSLL